MSRQKSKATRVVAYFCRQYAVQLGLKLLDAHPDQANEATGFLMPIMDELEAFKRDVGAPSQEDGKVWFCAVGSVPLCMLHMWGGVVSCRAAL